MLHLLDQAGGLRTAQEPAHVAQTSAEADAADAHAAAKAVGALHKLVSVLHALARQRPPLAGAATHVARRHPGSQALLAQRDVIGTSAALPWIDACSVCLLSILDFVFETIYSCKDPALRDSLRILQHCFKEALFGLRTGTDDEACKLCYSVCFREDCCSVSKSSTFAGVSTRSLQRKEGSGNQG